MEHYGQTMTDPIVFGGLTGEIAFADEAFDLEAEGEVAAMFDVDLDLAETDQ